jgi:ATP-dependent helicase/nuclease subunit A
VSGTLRAELRGGDAKARRLAQCEFGAPLVLEAGAGTGKTAALVARTLAWLLGPGWERAETALRAGADVQAPPPERVAARALSRVVAITFTEAAAAEMATRVEAALCEIERGELPLGVDPDALPDEPARHARGSALRGALDHLVVQTIHAYCRRLLLAHPFDAGLHPGFEVDADGRVQAEIVREVVERHMRRANAARGESAALVLAAAGIGPLEIQQELMALLGRGVEAAALADDPLAPDRVRAECERLRSTLEEFHAAFAERLMAVRRGNRAQEVARAVDHTRQYLAQPPDDLAGLEALLAELVERWGDSLLERLRKWSRSDLTDSEREALGAEEPRLAELSAQLAAPLEHWIRLDVPLFTAARRVLAQLLEEVEESMRRRGSASFSRLLTQTAALVAEQPSVARRVRLRIDQILVDEFQDTDRCQCAIIGALALEGPPDERPGLFIVGDAKQSIYGWRSADLAAYESFADRVCAEGGARHALSVNFRSVPAILDEVDRVVAPVMIRAPGLQPSFQPLVPSPENAVSSQVAEGRFAPVEYWVSAQWEGGAPRKTSAREAAELEARALAVDLRELRVAEGVEWRDVGVLFRSRGDWDIYLGALREADIPFTVEGDRSYYRRREVIDAAALLRCVLDPNDHLALLTVLRSSAVGVPDAALLPLWRHELPARVGALSAPDPESLGALRAALDDVVRALPDAVPGLDRVRGWDANLHHAASAIAQLRQSFAGDPADVFVERLRTSFLLEVSEAARFLGAWRVANLERFFRRITEELAQGADARRVLRSVRSAVSEEEPGEEGQPRDLAPDAVRVLTLHGAKGLDFDHVYLMQLHKGSGQRSQGGSQAHEHHGHFELCLAGAPSLGWDLALAARNRVAEAERVRTLYVGMTRAKKRLVLAGLWPAFQTGRVGGTHVDLLGRRQPAPPDLAQLLRACAEAGGVDSTAAAQTRWVSPALRALRPVPAAPAMSAPPLDLARVRAHAETLARAREGATERMARPLGTAASAAAHAGEQPLDAPTRPDGERAGTSTDGLLAKLAGVAVHRALEDFDLEADPAAELARQRAALEAVLSPLVPPDRLEAAVREARARLQHLAEGSLLERLRALRGRVVARELPILLAAQPGERPLEFVSGVIDLVYRDPGTDAFVIADYKTDRLDDAAAIDAHTRAYARQGAAYQRAVREAFDLTYTPRFELWYLAYDRCVDVAADFADSAATRARD